MSRAEAEGSAADLSVDILINNYNYGRFLAAAIDSALAQTHPRTRVIVVDDGSTDDSATVLDRFAGQVDVIRKPNGGQASAFNAGLASAEGDIVIFLDADDVLEPEAAARAAAAFAAAPALSRVQWRMRVIDAGGRPSGEVKPAAHLPLPSGDFRAAELAYPFDLAWMATSANAFRSAPLRRLLPVPEDEFPVAGADWYVIHLSTLLGPVRSLEEVLSCYRVHGDNSYEQQEAELDLDHVREAVGYAEITSRELLRQAAAEGMAVPDRILSVADLANRMVSLRLDPGRHPIAADSRWSLARDGLTACRRRDNVSATMKLMFACWFGAMATAPRRLAETLAVGFLFPQRRRGLNDLLGRLQRAG
jgi:hypothetical protein